MQKYMKLVSDQLFSNIFDKWTSHCCTGERQAMILNDFKSSLIPSQLISPGETSERERERQQSFQTSRFPLSVKINLDFSKIIDRDCETSITLMDLTLPLMDSWPKNPPL